MITCNVVLIKCYPVMLFCVIRYIGPEVIKLFSCSTQLSMKFSLQINMKMPTIVGSAMVSKKEIAIASNLRFINMTISMLN